MMLKWQKLQKGKVCNMYYHNITKDDMLNGDGFRTVLWVSGCSHGCKGCHNQITWDSTSGLEFDDDAKEELFEQLGKDYISGITYSGGDPLFQGNRDKITKLAEEIKEKFPQKTQWLYTGYTWEEIKELPVLKNIDVLVDGRFVEEKKDAMLHWKGSANQRVIDVPKSLRDEKVHLYKGDTKCKE